MTYTDGSRSKVLFIGGYGRSGSTLLGRILGHTDGFFYAGEVRHMWREGVLEDRRCGCGEPFSRCPLWQEVLRRAYPDGSDVQQVLDLKARVDRFFCVPQIAAGLPAGFRRDRDRYTDLLARLYRAIEEVSGARVIVDSSSDVSHGWLLTKTDIDLAIVHLVRDSRATAFSWARHKFNPGSGGEMNRYSAVRSALEWDAINAFTHLQRRSGVPFTVLRYDDLVADPPSAIARAISLTGEQVPPPLEANEITFEIDHSVAGNPIRFRNGQIAIRADEEWRTAMRPAARAAVGALTWPGRRRYGFT